MGKSLSFFFFNDTATTEIYTLSLHDALPIFLPHAQGVVAAAVEGLGGDPLEVTHARQGEVHQAIEELVHLVTPQRHHGAEDRKSTRLNSSHANISYAVFCLKKKKYLYLSLHS